jgi:hypothetical protein
MHGSCSVTRIPREPVDRGAYTYFEQVGLDVDATRAQLAESRDRKLSEVRALFIQAERAERLASEALTRVKRDYTRGAIAADEWHELRPELIEEHEGAQAEVQRLRDQEQEVECWGELEDAEAETLRLLSGDPPRHRR